MSETQIILETIENFIDAAPEFDALDRISTERDGDNAVIVTVNDKRFRVEVTELEDEDESEED